MKTKFKKIEKENIQQLVFPNEEVLKSHKKRNLRKLELERAMVLGNLEKIKVKIYFKTDSDMFVVSTTIWGATEDRVILKQGFTIPNQRILKIN